MILVLIAKTQLSFWTRQLTLVTAAYFYLDHSGTDTKFVYSVEEGKKNLVIISVVYTGYLQKKKQKTFQYIISVAITSENISRQVKMFSLYNM